MNVTFNTTVYDKDEILKLGYERGEAMYKLLNALELVDQIIYSKRLRKQIKKAILSFPIFLEKTYTMELMKTNGHVEYTIPYLFHGHLGYSLTPQNYTEDDYLITFEDIKSNIIDDVAEGCIDCLEVIKEEYGTGFTQTAKIRKDFEEYLKYGATGRLINVHEL